MSRARIDADSDFSWRHGERIGVDERGFPQARDLDKDILLCLDAIESKGPGCIEAEILNTLLAERHEQETPMDPPTVWEKDVQARQDEDGLLPCPFCARDVDLINGNGNPAAVPRWLVVCEACGSFHFDENETEQEVQTRWNTRSATPQPAPDAMREAREVVTKLLDAVKELNDDACMPSDEARHEQAVTAFNSAVKRAKEFTRR